MNTVAQYAAAKWRYVDKVLAPKWIRCKLCNRDAMQCRSLYQYLFRHSLQEIKK